MRQHEQRGGVNHALTGDRQRERAERLTDRLTHAGRNERNRHEHHAELLKTQHGRAGGDDFGVVHENANDCRRERADGEREHQSQTHFEQIDELENGFQVLAVSGAVIVADERLTAKRKADQNKRGDHVRLERNSHRRDLASAVGQQKMVGQHDHQALHDVCDGRRNADGENIAHHNARDFPVRERYRKPLGFLYNDEHEVNICNQVAENGRHRRAGRALMQNKDENRVENDVCDRTEDRAVHGLLHESLGAQDIGRNHAENNGCRAYGDPCVVVAGVNVCGAVRTECAQNRSSENQQNHADADAESKRRPRAKRTGVSCVLLALLTEQARDHRAAAQPENITERNHDGEKRRDKRHTGHELLHAGQRDKIGIDHVVDERDDHAHDDRHRELKVGFVHRRFFK